jgi:23S rRNA pseudouridine2457 synthase
MQYILFNKPYAVLSQFTDTSGRKTLKNFGPFPADMYAVGRLDYDSEGLLLLSNDKRIITRLLQPRFRHSRTYLVQVERIPTVEAITTLQNGILLDGRKTLPAEVALLSGEPDIPPRSVPVRFRKSVPTAWLTITLHEGRNRQVRRMTAAVGFPTLRLIRISIANLSLGNLESGKHRAITRGELAALRTALGLKQ